MLIAIVENMGLTYYLTGTTWTLARERASEYDNGAAAILAVDRAKKFMPKKLAKKIKIKEG